MYFVPLLIHNCLTSFHYCPFHFAESFYLHQITIQKVLQHSFLTLRQYYRIHIHMLMEFWTMPQLLFFSILSFSFYLLWLNKFACLTGQNLNVNVCMWAYHVTGETFIMRHFRPSRFQPNYQTLFLPLSPALFIDTPS